MSSVEQAGTVTEISPSISFVKILMCSYQKAGQPSY